MQKIKNSKVTVIKVQSVTTKIILTSCMSSHQTSQSTNAFVILALHDHIPKHVTGNYTCMLRQTFLHILYIWPDSVNTKEHHWCCITSPGQLIASIVDCTFKILPQDKEEIVMCSTLHGTLWTVQKRSTTAPSAMTILVCSEKGRKSSPLMGTFK